jgi:peptidyl-dipeptidase Dcp
LGKQKNKHNFRNKKTLMRKYLILSFTALLLSCNQSEKIELNKKSMENNPLLVEFKTPYGVPLFEQIKPEHFIPAIKEGVKEHQQEIEKIANNKELPTFENTIEAIDNSGKLLRKIVPILDNLTSAETNEELQKVEKEASPILIDHYDKIKLNEQLFARIKAIYTKKDSINLNPEQTVLLEKYYKDFVRGGANLKTEAKETLKSINKELAMLSIKFGDNNLAETNAFELIIDKKEDLKGLPQSIIEAAEETAKEKGKSGKWIFTLQKPSLMPFLMYAENRELRKKMQDAYLNTSDQNNANDNKEIVAKIIKLRQQKAELLGYKNYAFYVLEENMAKTPDKVYELINKLMKASTKKAIQERTELQKLATKEGKNFKIDYFDWSFYAEKLKKEKYNVNDEILQPYFELNNVRNGAFMVANKLYGINFTKVDTVPVYQKDVEVYRVTEADGKEIGILYMDFFVRAGKKSGAWMTSFRDQYKENGKNIEPIISTVFNFAKPLAGKPSLLTLEEVETVFHEFGHALHGLLSNSTYISLSGTSVARDFVELPSQVMENWATDLEVLKLYAKNYKTGEVIPDSLIKKIDAASKFNQGFITTEYLAAAILDMDWHTKVSDFNTIDVRDFENKSLTKMGLIPEIKVRYRSTYFSHIFQGGYAVGYYGYIWAAILDSDAFNAFKETNIFDKETAKKFRDNIISRGGTEDPMKLYVNFRGREPKIEALINKRGLN